MKLRYIFSVLIWIFIVILSPLWALGVVWVADDKIAWYYYRIINRSKWLWRRKLLQKG